jgi:hypothetical protein
MMERQRVLCRMRRDERTVETMSRSVRARRREQVVLVVVERSYLGAACLAEAYEQVVPTIQRSRRRQAHDSRAAPAAERARRKQ